MDLLKLKIARLKRNCSRLIWSKPVLGAPDHEPLARGIQNALPHIDDFLPVHNLVSLEDLADRRPDIDRRRYGGNHARYPA